VSLAIAEGYSSVDLNFLGAIILQAASSSGFEEQFGTC